MKMVLSVVLVVGQQNPDGRVPARTSLEACAEAGNLILSAVDKGGAPS